MELLVAISVLFKAGVLRCVWISNFVVNSLCTTVDPADMEVWVAMVPMST